MTGQNLQPSAKDGPGFFYGYVIVAVSVFILAAIWGTYSAFGVFFKPLIAEFGWSRALTSGAFSLSLFVYGVLSIIAGRLTDKFGPRLVMTLSGFLLGAGYILMSQINTDWQLYVIYGVIIGTGMSGGWIPLLSTVARWFTKRRTLMSGIALSGMGIGRLIGPQVANWGISVYGWRISYIIMGGVVLVIVPLISQFLKRDPTKTGQKPYGENQSEHGLNVESGGLSLREAYLTKQFWLLSTISFFLGFSIYLGVTHITPYAIDLGMSPGSAAATLGTIGGMVFIGRIILGHAADRIGNKQIYVTGLGLILVAYLWLVFAKEAWMLYIFAGILGLAMGGGGAAESPLVVDLFGLKSHGFLYGFINLGFTFGSGIGPFLAGYIFDTTKSYQMAFVLCIVASTIGLILIAFLKPLSRKI